MTLRLTPDLRLIADGYCAVVDGEGGVLDPRNEEPADEIVGGLLLDLVPATLGAAIDAVSRVGA